MGCSIRDSAIIFLEGKTLFRLLLLLLSQPNRMDSLLCASLCLSTVDRSKQNAKG